MIWLELNSAEQSWFNRMKVSGLKTQLCGAPVLSVMLVVVL